MFFPSIETMQSYYNGYIGFILVTSHKYFIICINVSFQRG